MMHLPSVCVKPIHHWFRLANDGWQWPNFVATTKWFYLNSIHRKFSFILFLSLRSSPVSLSPPPQYDPSTICHQESGANHRQCLVPSFTPIYPHSVRSKWGWGWEKLAVSLLVVRTGVWVPVAERTPERSHPGQVHFRCRNPNWHGCGLSRTGSDESVCHRASLPNGSANHPGHTQWATTQWRSCAVGVPGLFVAQQPWQELRRIDFRVPRSHRRMPPSLGSGHRSHRGCAVVSSAAFGLRFEDRPSDSSI